MCVVSEPRKEKQYRNHKSLIQTMLVSDFVSEKHLRIWFSINTSLFSSYRRKERNPNITSSVQHMNKFSHMKSLCHEILTTQNIIIWMVGFLLDFLKSNFHWDDSFLHGNKSAPVEIFGHKIFVTQVSQLHRWDIIEWWRFLLDLL